MVNVMEFQQTGGPEQLMLVDRDIPAPDFDEVQVEIRATGLNRAELLYLGGQYLVDPVFPSQIGVEGSGVVTALGENVETFAVGDSVSITPNLSPDLYGVLAERANLPVTALQPIPPGLSFTEAAAFWMAYLTAYGGLVQAGGLRPDAGQVVLISAASSSVGTAAIQIAQAHGATAIATTRTSEKVEKILSAGADHVIATQEEKLEERVKDITNGNGFDLAFDAVSGPFVESIAAAAGREATLVEYGILSGQATPLPLFSMIGKGLTIRSFHLVFDLLMHPTRHKAAREHLLDGLGSGAYKPTIDSIFPFEHSVDAYKRLASNQQFGKVLIGLAEG